jgi:glycosyltransferase involved in cell wall biosynthesis
VHGAIVGGTHPTKEGYAQELQQYVAQRGLQSHITFVGHRTDAKEILALSALVYSLSTTPESFGRTTLEALSMGRPVIGYSHGGVQEQLTQLFPEGLVPVGAIQDAVDKTTEFLKEMPMLQEQDTFTLDSMCSQTLALYQDFCRSGVQLQ